MSDLDNEFAENIASAMIINLVEEIRRLVKEYKRITKQIPELEALNSGDPKLINKINNKKNRLIRIKQIVIEDEQLILKDNLGYLRYYLNMDPKVIIEKIRKQEGYNYGKYI